ncbi:MAG: SPW repeat protein [Patescibacteria group bacterium]
MMKWYHWVEVGLGAWLLLAPWILGYSEVNLASWNSILVGGLMIVFALWNFTPPSNHS